MGNASGKRLHWPTLAYGKCRETPLFLWAMFNSYVQLPEDIQVQLEVQMQVLAYAT